MSPSQNSQPVAAPKVSLKVRPHQAIAVKVFHWINLISVWMMLTSGLQIYNANPVFGGREGWHFPPILLLGGWLAGGRDWHFAGMNLFALNFLAYGLYVLFTRRWRIRFLGRNDLRAIVRSRSTQRKVYAWHRMVYTAILPVLLLAIVSGLGMYKPAQFAWIVAVFGNDWQVLRTVHFLTVPLTLVFSAVHSTLALRAGGTKLVDSMFW